MTDQPSYPTHPSAIWKRKQNDAMEAASGLKFCTSCRTLRPVNEVKIYRSVNKKHGMPRCDTCQANRMKALKERKNV